jgi:hypothetical protein
MNRRTRLHRCYFHQEVDRPAVYLRTNYPDNDPTYDAVKALMAELSELKAWWDSGRVQEPLPISDREEPVNADWKRWVQVLHTPTGDLEKSYLLSLKGLPGMCERHFVKEPADVEKYLSLPVPKLGGDLETFCKADREMGDRGIVEVELGGNPASSTVDAMGSETFAMWSVTDRELLHAMCRRHQEALLGRVKHLLALGAGPYFCISGQEFLVPPLHGPADFADFCTRYDKPVFDLIHEAGGAIHVHCHSKIGQVIGQFVEMGVSVLHPFEAPPMGDITARAAKQAARGKMTLEGNIQIADLYEKPADDIRRQVRELIRDVFDDRRGLIVSPTASAYQFGKGQECLEQCRAMVGEVVGKSV